jgi:hypothetical protein
MGAKQSYVNETYEERMEKIRLLLMEATELICATRKEIDEINKNFNFYSEPKNNHIAVSKIHKMRENLRRVLTLLRRQDNYLIEGNIVRKTRKNIKKSITTVEMIGMVFEC